MRVSDLGVTRLFGVKGKTILVTGGARGIGLMIAAGFVANGATVYIASRSADACETAARRLTAAGPGTCHALAADLGTETGCAALAAALKSREQALHVLVNNSGTSWGAPMATHDTKGWDKTYNLNVKGVFFLTRELLPLLDAASTPTDPARVINIGSVAGIRPQVFPTFSYDVSKAAVHHLTRKLADELADRRSEGGHAITVNAIAPGYVPSRMSASGEYEESERSPRAAYPSATRRAADMRARRSSSPERRARGSQVSSSASTGACSRNSERVEGRIRWKWVGGE